LTSITLLNSSGVTLATGARTVTIALLTQTSIGPKRSSVSAARRSTAAGSVTSPQTITASEPAALASSAVARRPSIDRAINPRR